MSNDLRKLLDRGAASPSTDVDVDTLVRTARGRRRRRVGVVAGSIVATVAVVIAAVVLAQPSSEVNIPTRPSAAAPPSASAPDGWKQITLDDERIRLAVPADWTKLRGWPNELGTVGSPDIDRSGELRACGLLVPKNVQIPDVSGEWLTLIELDDPAPSGIITLPDGYRLDTSKVVPRPADFRSLPIVNDFCLVDNFSGPGQVGSYEFIAFREADRTYVARILVHGPSRESDFLLAREVLNTMAIGEPGTSTTSTSTSTTVETVPAATTVPTTAPAAATGEEADIRAVFLAWLDAQERNAMDGIVEDFASIAATHLEGMHQHSEADLAKYSGRVDSVTIIDATHADVRYTVLFDGRPQFSMVPGQAIKIDGRWMVSRETVCNLLKNGGLTCPPRA